MSPAQGCDLARFVEAQEGVYAGALAELRAGRKESHWMWFVFPQIAGLGMSAMSQRYAIRDAAEARAYLDHPLLGSRLRACTEAVRTHEDKSADAIFGPVDAIKLRSSMTLFERVESDGDPFGRCLDAFFDGARDERTLALIDGSG